ncbi:sulfotransferase family protein [Cognatishimia maritima]|uniref:Sulfotransferase domain-containing protein n=1 Tax=Cognatishimia maritima TaxID=870908 RepID=A0A1M5WE32_9RHOB|nr:sulfotransferase [Cognatishimia maritima]SHH85483.1 Sulfotransferase domain-containing protein [Cognatishimia maritima]
MSANETIGKFPNLFLVGAPKCGTTTLHHLFTQHPDVYCPYRKEPATLIGTPVRQNGFSMGYSDYWAMYEGWRSQRYALDASALYFASRSAAENISTFSPKAKIIVALRNPVEAIYSFYYEAKSQSHEKQISFEEALEADDARPEGAGVYRPRYRQTFSFTGHLNRYRELFGPENVYVVLMQDLKRSPQDEYQRICDWLGISTDVSDTDFASQNKAKAPRSTTLAKFILSPPKALQRPLSKIISKEKRYRFQTYLRKINFREEQYPPMQPETRGILIQYFRPDIERLEQLLDRDLSEWKM